MRGLRLATPQFGAWRWGRPPAAPVPPPVVVSDAYRQQAFTAAHLAARDWDRLISGHAPEEIRARGLARHDLLAERLHHGFLRLPTLYEDVRFLGLATRPTYLAVVLPRCLYPIQDGHIDFGRFRIFVALDQCPSAVYAEALDPICSENYPHPNIHIPVPVSWYDQPVSVVCLGDGALYWRQNWYQGEPVEALRLLARLIVTPGGRPYRDIGHWLVPQFRDRISAGVTLQVPATAPPPVPGLCASCFEDVSTRTTGPCPGCEAPVCACGDCVARCARCEGYACRRCRYVCHDCTTEGVFCSACLGGTCCGCENRFCADHAEDFTTCAACEGQACSACQVECGVCETVVCQSCDDFMACSCCDRRVCEDHRRGCYSCPYTVCDTCWEDGGGSCEACDRDYCQSCWDDRSRCCAGCGDSYCSSRISSCQACDDFLCGDCVQRCDDCGGRHCEGCLSAQDCGHDVCGECAAECRACARTHCADCQRCCSACSAPLCATAEQRCGAACVDCDEWFCPDCQATRREDDEATRCRGCAPTPEEDDHPMLPLGDSDGG